MALFGLIMRRNGKNLSFKTFTVTIVHTNRCHQKCDNEWQQMLPRCMLKQTTIRMGHILEDLCTVPCDERFSSSLSASQPVSYQVPFSLKNVSALRMICGRTHEWPHSGEATTKNT